MQLSPLFDLDELTFSQTAIRKNIDNTPPSAVLNNMRVLVKGLENIRTLLGASMRISSGYRCAALNDAVGGSVGSAHMDGYAADFTCPSFGSPSVIVEAIRKSGIPVDQCIMEGTWVHISFAPAMRNQFKKATFINGKPKYTNY